MSLSVALSNARSSLASTAKQIAVSGRNIAGADDPTYTRKIATPTTGVNGSVAVLSITRATDLGLIQRVLAANASASGEKALLDGLDRLAETVGDTNSTNSPAARIAALSSALEAQLNMPSDRSLAQATVTAAEGVVSTLANATSIVTAIRNEADDAIGASVDRVNGLLSRLADLNAAAMRGTFTGDDVSSVLDQRDAVIGELSGEIGLTVIHRANNDIAVFTESGVPLFDRVARTVSFQDSTHLAPGTSGSAVLIDGVPVTGANASMELRTGAIAGLTKLRDDIAPAYQAQIDELARGLVESFAESDQSGGGGPDLAGLFTYVGGPAVPASGTLVSGLAGILRVNPAVVPASGGSLDRIRDGGINGVAYRYNSSSMAAFSDRLDEMVTGLTTGRTFDAASQLGSGIGIRDFGTASIGWLQNLRQTTSISVDYQNTLLGRASETLSNASGVNLDEEYAKQLQLEQSFAASSKLIAVINQLFDSLMNAVG